MNKLLRLIAFDVDDLHVLSAHLQDAQLSLGEISYIPAKQKFALVAARFNWLGRQDGEDKTKVSFKTERLWSGLHFERVRKVSCKGLDLKDRQNGLNLLSITFAPLDPPAGRVELIFSGGAALRLEVECLEALLQDLGPSWPAEDQPGHEA